MKLFRILISMTALVLLPACATVSITPVAAEIPTRAQPSPSPTPSPRPTATATPGGGTFGELTFSDEFNGPEIDTARWFVENGHQDYWPDTPWRRNFKKENVYIEDGALVIRTAKEKVGFSSGAIVTGVKGQPAPFEQAFGRFEARMRFPAQPGHGCAFWLWNTSQGNIDGSGRDGTEIDILEKIWLTDQIDHALHWDGYGADHESAVEYVQGMGLDDGGWHTARLDWYPDQYVFFIDGKETWRTSAGGVAQAPNFVLFSDEIVPWGSGPIENAILPDYFYVDYVRVYKYVPPQ
jgi:beta-glucanase (GH16 family)